MSVRVEVEVNSRFKDIAAQVGADLTKGVNLAAERLLALSSEVVPFDIGTLSASGQVERAQTPDEGAAVTYDQPYAARLHEHPEYNFQGGRQGKYVEGPAMGNKDELGAIIARQVSRG